MGMDYAVAQRSEHQADRVSRHLAAPAKVEKITTESKAGQVTASAPEWRSYDLKEHGIERPSYWFPKQRTLVAANNSWTEGMLGTFDRQLLKSFGKNPGKEEIRQLLKHIESISYGDNRGPGADDAIYLDSALRYLTEGSRRGNEHCLDALQKIASKWRIGMTVKMQDSLVLATIATAGAAAVTVSAFAIASGPEGFLVAGVTAIFGFWSAVAGASAIFDLAKRYPEQWRYQVSGCALESLGNFLDNPKVTRTVARIASSSSHPFNTVAEQMLNHGQSGKS